MTVKKFYRYGIAADKKIFEADRNALNGVVIPAHLACDQPSLASFLRKLGAPYFVDPMTFCFGLAEADLNSPNGTLKRSYAKLIEKVKWPREIDWSGAERLQPGDFTWGGDQPVPQAVRDFVESILNVQSRLAKDEKEMKELAKLAKLMLESGEDLGFDPEKMAEEFPPTFKLSPYFFFDRYTSPWYLVNKRLYDVARGLGQDSVYPVLAIHSQFLTNGQFDRLLTDFAGAPGFVVWVDDFREVFQSPFQLFRLRQLCKTLSANGTKPVVSLYSGMFQAFLEKDGLSTICSGLGYSESKASVVAAGGLPAPRYYTPEVFQNLVREDLTPLLRSLGTVSCTCKICSAARQVANPPSEGWVDRFLFSGFFPAPKAGGRTFADGENQLNLKTHFLLCTAAQVSSFAGRTTKQLAADLTATYQRLEQANQIFARTRAAHLQRWAEALAADQDPAA